MFKKMRFVSILMVLAMVFSFSPIVGTNTNAESTKEYVISEDALCTDVEIGEDCIVKLENNAVLTINNINIHNCHITFTGTGKVVTTERIIIGNDVTITMDKGVTLEAEKGIDVVEEASLTLDGEGTIIATGTGIQAGIGSGRQLKSCGTITINNGNITAIGGSNGSRFICGAAGIGGADISGGGYHGGRITINGGNVTAFGGGRNEMIPGIEGYYGGAGIGGGDGGTVDSIIINGGKIDAQGGVCAASIGSGNGAHGHSSNIIISGGNVNCSSNIGGGNWHSYDYSEEVTVSITGGIVTAPEIGYGTGINGSGKADVSIGWTKDTDRITIGQGGFKNTTSFKLTSPFSKDGVLITEEEAVQNDFPACTLYPVVVPTTEQPTTTQPTTEMPTAKPIVPKNITKIIIKKIKKLKKHKKKNIVKVVLKIDGKAVKGKKITLNIKKKKFKARTNKSGIAKFKIKKKVLKKLKVGKKVKLVAKYGKNKATRKVKVVK